MDAQINFSPEDYREQLAEIKGYSRVSGAGGLGMGPGAGTCDAARDGRKVAAALASAVAAPPMPPCSHPTVPPCCLAQSMSRAVLWIGRL